MEVFPFSLTFIKTNGMFIYYPGQIYINELNPLEGK